jgi:hypothetical protein
VTRRPVVSWEGFVGGQRGRSCLKDMRGVEICERTSTLVISTNGFSEEFLSFNCNAQKRFISMSSSTNSFLLSHIRIICPISPQPAAITVTWQSKRFPSIPSLLHSSTQFQMSCMKASATRSRLAVTGSFHYPVVSYHPHSAAKTPPQGSPIRGAGRAALTKTPGTCRLHVRSTQPYLHIPHHPHAFCSRTLGPEHCF